MSVERPVQVVITPGTIVTAILFVVLVGLLWYLRGLLFIVLTAVVIASAAEPPVAVFMRYGLPRVLAVMLIYICVAIVMAGTFYLFVPLLIHESSGFMALLPEYLKSFHLDEGFASLGAFGETLSSFQNLISGTSSGALTLVSSVFGGLLSLVLIVVLSFYFAVQETGIDDFLRLIAPIHKQRYILDLWRRSQHKIGRWMQGQVILSLIAGVLVWAGLELLGVRYALLLGASAAVLELIPVFGSILAAVPAVAIAFIDGGTSLALLVIALYVVVNQSQANIIYPLVMRRIVDVPPLLVILALIIGAQLAGFLGIILSVPVAAGLREFVVDVQRGKKKRIEEHEARIQEL